MAIKKAEANKVNRLSAEAMTIVLRAMFGSEYVARAYKGRRVIAKNFSPLSFSSVVGKSWVEALQLARAQFGWQRTAFAAQAAVYS